ncbi:hypothetical protein, partial [Bacteroides fragilis]
FTGHFDRTTERYHIIKLNRMKKRELFNSKVKAKGQAIEPRDGSRPIVYVMAATCMPAVKIEEYFR